MEYFILKTYNQKGQIYEELFCSIIILLGIRFFGTLSYIFFADFFNLFLLFTIICLFIRTYVVYFFYFWKSK